MTGASPVTTILRVTPWQSHATPCMVVTGLAPVMPLPPITPSHSLWQHHKIKRVQRPIIRPHIHRSIDDAW
jgi:hypothetical protein